LTDLPRRRADIERVEPCWFICASGYLSANSASILALNGFAHVSNVVGGTSGWMAEKLPVEA